MNPADEENFENVESGASTTYPQQCSALRKNGHVVIKDKACKIVEMSTSKTGKHGHAKVHLVGIDIFTGKKLEDICPSTHNMDVPSINRTEYELCSIDDGFMSLMNDQGDMRSDLKIPDGDVGKDITDKFENDDTVTVTVLKAMGQEIAISSKLAKQ